MMEAGGVSLRDWIRERFESYDTRLRSHHDRLGNVQERQSRDGETLVEIKATQREQGADIVEMKKDLKAIKWGLFSAIAVGLMFVVAVGTLIVQVSG
jgi:hypothetical protein